LTGNGEKLSAALNYTGLNNEDEIQLKYQIRSFTVTFEIMDNG